jgi:hypothetical protein
VITCPDIPARAQEKAAVCDLFLGAVSTLGLPKQAVLQQGTRRCNIYRSILQNSCMRINHPVLLEAQQEPLSITCPGIPARAQAAVCNLSLGDVTCVVAQPSPCQSKPCCGKAHDEVKSTIMRNNRHALCHTLRHRWHVPTDTHSLAKWPNGSYIKFDCHQRWWCWDAKCSVPDTPIT